MKPWTASACATVTASDPNSSPATTNSWPQSPFLATPAATGSIAALITDYRRSPEFARLGPKTQESYLRALDVLQPIDRYRASDLKRAHLLALRDTLSDKPRTADMFVATARRLLSWGVDRGYLEHNPLMRVSPINEAASRVTWTDADCAAYEAAETRPAVLRAMAKFW